MELLILCLEVFLVRIIDVTLGTMQTIYIVKGDRKIGTLLGFVDVFIWFVIIKEALTTTNDSIWIALAYSGGYAVGTYIGSFLSQFFSKGTLNIQVITSNINNKVIEAIKNNNFSGSIIKCKGIHKEEDKYMIYSEVESKRLNSFKKIIKNIDKEAFVTVTESKEIINGYFGK